jgi:hypothetical protein
MNDTCPYRVWVYACLYELIMPYGTQLRLRINKNTGNPTLPLPHAKQGLVEIWVTRSNKPVLTLTFPLLRLIIITININLFLNLVLINMIRLLNNVIIIIHRTALLELYLLFLNLKYHCS